MKKKPSKTEQPCTIHSVIGSATKGRDKTFRCVVCGKYIAYADIPNKVKVEFIPDTEYTMEATSFTHLHCL